MSEPYCHECTCWSSPPCSGCTDCEVCNPCWVCDEAHDGPRDDEYPEKTSGGQR